MVKPVRRRILAGLAVLGFLFVLGTTTAGCEPCAEAASVPDYEARRKPKPDRKDCPPPSKRKKPRRTSPTTVAILVCNSEDRWVTGKANGSGYKPRVQIEVEFKVEGPGGWKDSDVRPVFTDRRGSWSASDLIWTGRKVGTYRLSVETFLKGRSVDVDSTDCRLRE
jgi:hypothetical protein